MLPIGQLPDAANVKALVRSYSAAASCLAASSRWCPLLLGIGAPPGSFFPMLLCGGPATMRRCICIFATALRQFCQGSSASNKPHSVRPASLFATAPWPVSPPRRPGQQHFPDGALPRRRLSQGAPPRCPGQQQTSFGGEKYSGLASNLAHLGWIC